LGAAGSIVVAEGLGGDEAGYCDREVWLTATRGASIFTGSFYVLDSPPDMLNDWRAELFLVFEARAA
jgi:hypothetical protein